jgi:hypothetical protein
MWCGGQDKTDPAVRPPWREPDDGYLVAGRVACQAQPMVTVIVALGNGAGAVSKVTGNSMG